MPKNNNLFGSKLSQLHRSSRISGKGLAGVLCLFFDVFSHLSSMVSLEEKTAFIQAQVEPDLAYIWNGVGLSMDIQHKLATEGYKSVRRLAAVEDTAPAVRTAFKDILSLDPGAHAAERLVLALLIDTWSICRVTAAKEIEARAEARVRGAASHVLVSSTDHAAMRRAVEKPRDTVAVTFNLPEDEVPAQAYLTDKLSEVEQNDPQATPLDEIINVEIKSDVDFTPVFDRAGTLRTVRRKPKVDVPASPEAYRKRMRVEMNLWLMIASKCHNKSWLADVREQTFTEFVDHILGKRVDRINTTDADPPMPKPSWNLVMTYEYALRRDAFKRVRRGEGTLDKAFHKALHDPELRSMHFIEPLLAGTRSVPQLPQEGAPLKRQRHLEAGAQGSTDIWSQAPWQQPPKGHGKKGQSSKGGGKGKAKGKDGRKPPRRIDPSLPLVMKTPDGRDICFLYNKGQCEGGCERVHCCRVKGCTHNGPACEHPHA